MKVTVECSATNVTSLSVSTHTPWTRYHSGRGDRSIRAREDQNKAVSSLHDRIAALINPQQAAVPACTRTSQDQGSQQSSIEWELAQEPSLRTEEVRKVDYFWERKSGFLRVRLQSTAQPEVESTNWKAMGY